MDRVLNELLPQVEAEGLADFIDVFCETNYFTVAELERILEAGAMKGMPGGMHEQLRAQGTYTPSSTVY